MEGILANKTVPNAKNWPEEKQQKLRVKKSGLRVIDTGNRYDVPGKLRRIIHQMEKGEYGEVRDIVVGIRSVVEGEFRIRTMFTGKGTMAEIRQIVDYLKMETLK